MLEFQKLSLKNFGPFGNTTTTIELNRKKTVLVSGANAQGKSYAFLDAITFGLFGKPFRNINIPQLVNSINKKQCLVEVHFSRGKNNYMVRRGLAPKLFEIFKDGVLVDQNAKSKDYQEFLEQYILGFNFHAFKQVVVLGKASFVPFMQLVPADRRKVVENILDLGIISEMASTVKITLSNLRTQYNQLLNEKTILTERLSSQEANFKKIQENQNKDLQEKRSNINISETKLKGYREQYDTLNSELQKVNQKLNEAQKKKAKREEMRKHLYSLEQSLVQILSSIDEIKSQKDCSSCGRAMTEETKVFASKALKERKDEYEKTIGKAGELLSGIDKELGSFEESFKAATDLQRKLAAVSTEIHTEEALLNREKLEAERIEKSKEIDIPDMAATKALLKENEQKTCEVVTEMEYYNYVLEMLKDDGLKAKIIRHYIPIINKSMNEYLTKLGLFVAFELDENFSETIKSRYRDEFSYNCFSEGEKQRIDLAILLTWREVARMKNSLNCNLLIFDDILDGPLETQGIESFMKIINKMKKNVSIYNLTHKTDLLVDKFDEHIAVVKKNNFSKLLYN